MSEQSNEQALEQIKDEAGKKYDHSELKINRVPDQAIEDLKDLAYDKFAGDYGLTLAYLLEVHKIKQEHDSQIAQHTEKVRELQEEVQALRQEIIDSRKSKDENFKVDTIG